MPESSCKIIPNICPFCNSINIEYWDETNEEIVYKCLNCNRFVAIPFNTNKLHVYFNF